MKKAFSLLVLTASLLAFLPAAKAQQQQPLTVPDATCKVFFNLSVASSGAQAAAWLPGVTPPPAGSVGSSLVIDNHQTGCYGWTVAYTNHGFGSLSLLLQSAPDNTGGTAPGTWATVAVCGGTECLGVNPNTAITSALTATKAIAPWFRMNLTAKSGTGAVVGVLYGYKYNTNSAGAGGGSGSCPAGANGQVQYDNAGVCAGIPSVTAGFVLTDNGSGVPPVYKAASGQTPCTFATLGSVLTVDGQACLCSNCTVTSSIDNTCANAGGASKALAVLIGTDKCSM